MQKATAPSEAAGGASPFVAAVMGDDEAPLEPGYTGDRNERNERDGQGVAVFVNGDKYEGGYVKGRRHGRGKYTFKSGAVYEGDYHNNAKHGKGKMSYVDKSCYDGDWKMDRRHGTGSYTYANGDIYAGSWCNGVKHGKGCYFFMASKCQFLGFWDDSKFTAGTWVMQDGSSFVGTFEGGPKGPGTYRFKDGTAMDGAVDGSKWAVNDPAATVSAATPATLEVLVASTGASAPKPLLKKKSPPDMTFASESLGDMPDLSAHTSLLAQVLKDDPSIWDTYKDVATSGGITFAKCIKPGLENFYGDGVGLIAGDEECYTTFGPAFDAVIAKRHGGYAADAVHKTGMDVEAIADAKLSEKYVLSVRLRTGRNLSGVNFPGATDVNAKQLVESAVVPALLAAGDGEYSPLMGSETYEPMPAGMGAAQEDRLRDDGLLFEEPDSAYAVSCGIEQDWPNGRGVFVNVAKTFMVWVNEHDHARVFSMTPGADVKGAFKTLFEGLSKMQAGVRAAGFEFAYSEHLGYISASPSNLGTCLRAAVMMNIPKFGAHADFNATLAKLGLVGVAGPGGKFEITTKQALGASEVEVANTLIVGVGQVIATEMALEGGLPLELSKLLSVKSSYPDNIACSVRISSDATGWAGLGCTALRWLAVFE